MEADVLSVREAAEQLGVSSERVRQLINAGSLPARRSSAGWLLRADAVAERTHSAARAGRPASPRTAWAILCLLSCALEGDGSNSKACAVRDRRLRHHVMHLLSAMPDPANDPERWRLLLASRGRAEQMWAHPGLLPRLCADDRVRAGGDRAAAQIGDGLSAAPVCDLYVPRSEVKKIVNDYGLRPDPSGQVRLHAVPEGVPCDLMPGRPGLVVPAAAAADLLDEGDPRARRSGLLQLSAMFAALTSRHPARPSPNPAGMADGGEMRNDHGSGHAR
jgi:excisionase family DNA binding protein